jgi:uncharacterized YigZ family protein
MSSDPSDRGYPVPAARHRVEQVIDRSRFTTTIERASSAGDARSFIDAIRREFPDASHSCWAFVAGPPGTTASVGLSDAGEPHGTAGRPMLDVLLHSGVGEIAAVVTRWFGGTKLGKGGLVRAYGGSVQQALATLPTVVLVARTALSVVVGYADVEIMRRLIAAHAADVTAENYGEAVSYEVQVPVSDVSAFERNLLDATSGRATIQRQA